MWRLLENGETIKSGDEYYSPGSEQEWVPMENDDIGETFFLCESQPIRRKISQKKVRHNGKN